MRRAAGFGLVAPLPEVSRVDQVEAVLREGILSGGWSGTLPGSRALCQVLGVSAETLARALERLRREGWVHSPGPRHAFCIVPRKAAAADVAGSRRKVVLVLGPADSGLEVPSGFWPLVGGLNAQLAADGWEVRAQPVHYTTNRKRRREWDQVVAANQPDAIVAILGNPELAAWARTIRQPLVFVGGSPGPESHSPCIGISSASGIRRAIHELTAVGHQRIVVPLSGRSEQFVTAMRRLLERVFAEHHMVFAPPVHAPASLEKGPDAYRECLRRAWQVHRPTAVVCLDWCEYAATLSFASNSGYRVPDDVSLVVLTRDPVMDWLLPKPCHFRNPLEQITRQLAEWIKEPPPAGPDAPSVEQDGEWVPGQTIAPPAGV